MHLRVTLPKDLLYSTSHISVNCYLWRDRIAVCDHLTPQHILDITQKTIDNLLDNGITLEQTVDETPF